MGRDEDAAELEQQRHRDDLEHEQVEAGDEDHGDRHHQPEEQERNLRMLAAVAGHDELVPGALRAEPVVELEAVDGLLHVGFRSLAQRHFLLRLREPLALAGADLVALEGDRLHAPAEAVALDERHRDGEHRRGGRDPDEDHGHELRVAELAVEKGNHRGALRVGLERDDFSSSRHPALLLCLSMIFSENR
jgi:hypothetical protein